MAGAAFGIARGPAPEPLRGRPPARTGVPSAIGRAGDTPGLPGRRRAPIDRAAGKGLPLWMVHGRRHFRAAPGLTLVEMLVVLVLVSLLGTLLIQGVGFFLGKYATVKRVHREASLATLRQHWFISTVQAMVPSRLEARRFAGDASSFEGVTLQPLAAESGLPVRARWSIGDDGASQVVVYAEEGGARWTVLTSDDEGIAFQYADQAGQWHDRWPVANDARERIPGMVRLHSTAGRTVWLARLDLFPEPRPNYRVEE